MTDALFPLPEPTFLWVDDLTLYPHSNASPIVDAEGRWEYVETESIPMRGYFATPSPREVDRAAAAGVVVDGVALVPNDSPISVDDSLVHGSLAYKVVLIRPNPSHTRVLLSRVDTTGPPWHFPEA